jgi:hypothetical protein
MLQQVIQPSSDRYRVTIVSGADQAEARPDAKR